MKTFCVSYDLISKIKDYDSVNEILENLKGEHIQGSVWLLRLDDKYTCKSLLNEILKYVNEYDIDLYVAQIIQHSRHKSKNDL